MGGLTALVLALLRGTLGVVSSPERDASAGTGTQSRVLGATTTSCAYRTANLHLLRHVRTACKRYPAMDVVLNIFDVVDPHVDLMSRCFPGATKPTCLRAMFNKPGHKAAFWRYRLTAHYVRPYDFIFAFDNDINVGDFDLTRAVKLMRASNVSIAQPRIHILAGHEHCEAATSAKKQLLQEGRRLFSTRPGSLERFAALSASNELRPAGCLVQGSTYVENQAPLMTSFAWRTVVHARLLQKLNMCASRPTFVPTSRALASTMPPPAPPCPVAGLSSGTLTGESQRRGARWQKPF